MPHNATKAYQTLRTFSRLLSVLSAESKALSTAVLLCIQTHLHVIVVQCGALGYLVLQYALVCCSVLQCVAVNCRALQCVAVDCLAYHHGRSFELVAYVAASSYLARHTHTSTYHTPRGHLRRAHMSHRCAHAPTHTPTTHTRTKHAHTCSSTPILS